MCRYQDMITINELFGFPIALGRSYNCVYLLLFITTNYHVMSWICGYWDHKIY